MPAALEHVGIAVTGGALERLLSDLLGLDVYKTEAVQAQGVETRFADAGAKIEFLHALSDDSPVARFIEKRGPGVHHLAFRVDDLPNALARARDANVAVIGEPSPGADGLRIAFLHPRDTHGVLIELCETRPDALPEPSLIETSAGSVAAYRWPSEAEAPLLVLLHGAGATTALETQHLARLMQPTRQVIAFDLPGHGASTSHAELTADLFIHGISEAVASLGEPVDLFGFSLGGAVALSVAQWASSHVRKLAVHSTSIDWDDELVEEMLARIDADTLRRRSPRGWTRLDAAHGGRAEGVLRSLHPFVRSLAGASPFVGAEPPRHPALVTGADGDDLFDVSHALRLRKRLTGAQLGILPGIGHRLGPVESDALAPLLLRFLES